MRCSEAQDKGEMNAPGCRRTTAGNHHLGTASGGFFRNDALFAGTYGSVVEPHPCTLLRQCFEHRRVTHRGDDVVYFGVGFVNEVFDVSPLVEEDAEGGDDSMFDESVVG